MPRPGSTHTQQPHAAGRVAPDDQLFDPYNDKSAAGRWFAHLVELKHVLQVQCTQYLTAHHWTLGLQRLTVENIDQGRTGSLAEHLSFKMDLNP